MIKVKNVKCKVVGLDSQMLNMLSNHLSVKVPNYYFSTSYKNRTWDGTQRFFTRPANTFPTGLLPKVVDFLQDYEEYDIELENYCSGTNYTIVPITDEESKIVGENKVLRD